MASLRSFLCTWVPGWEKLDRKLRDAESRVDQADRDRQHYEHMQELRRRTDRANAERYTAEAEHDRHIYGSVLGADPDDARAVLTADTEIERQLVERAGLRKIRETIFTAQIPGEAVAQVLAGLNGGSMRLAAPPGGAVSSEPGIAPQLDAQAVERLAMLFVTRVGTASDPAERERLFGEWRDELRRQLPSFQAEEVEARARHLLTLVS